MKKPVKPNRPDRGKLDWQDDTKLDDYYYGDGREEVVIYGDSKSLCDDCDYDDWCDECDNEGCEECKPKSEDHDDIETLTLQDIIDKIPEGYSPSDVRIKVGYYISQMGLGRDANYWIHFVCRKPIDLQAELDRYAKEKKRYKKEMAEYKKAKKEYDEWKHEQDVAKAQAKLDELKAKK